MKNTGKLIDGKFKQTYLVPIIKDICEDVYGKKLSMHKLFRKITIKGLIYFPEVFTDDLFIELKSQINKNYINRIYHFFCGEHLLVCDESRASNNIRGWNYQCKKRARQYEIDEHSGNLKRKSIKSEIKRMSVNEFRDFCEGIFNENERRIFLKKCRQENKMWLYWRYFRRILHRRYVEIVPWIFL